MIHYQRSLIINATPEAIWAVISRYMHIDEFAPQVKSVDALTKGEDGVGSKRRCHFENGTSLVEEVIDWQAGKSYRIQLSEMDAMPIHEMYADITLHPQSNSQVNVVWGMDYRVKFGPFGWLLGQTLMKLMMGKIVDENLKGLAEKVQ
jgi:hypothetical protein